MGTRQQWDGLLVAYGIAHRLHGHVQQRMARREVLGNMVQGVEPMSDSQPALMTATTGDSGSHQPTTVMPRSQPAITMFAPWCAKPSAMAAPIPCRPIRYGC